MTRLDGPVAVLLPSVELGAYWGPVIRELDRMSGEARLLTAHGWPNWQQDPTADLVTIVGTARRISTDADAKAYGGGVMVLPVRVVVPLLRLRPAAVYTMGFSLWTVLALLLKPFLRWRVVLMWEGSSPGVDHRDSALRTRIRAVMARLADRLITSNHRSRDYLVDHLGAPGDTVDVHPLLVPSVAALTAGADRAPAIADLPAPRLLVVGRLETRKGIDPLLRALAALGDSTPWSLAVIGTGEEEPALRATAERLGVAGRVSWLGWVAYPDLGAHLAAADFLAFPTLEDTWGMVAAEAMAVGTPVICSIHAGVSEILTDGVDGVLVDPTNSTAFAARLGEVVRESDPDELGRAALRRIGSLTPAATAAALLRAASGPAEG